MVACPRGKRRWLEVTITSRASSVAPRERNGDTAGNMWHRRAGRRPSNALKMRHEQTSRTCRMSESGPSSADSAKLLSLLGLEVEAHVIHPRSINMSWHCTSDRLPLSNETSVLSYSHACLDGIGCSLGSRKTAAMHRAHACD